MGNMQQLKVTISPLLNTWTANKGINNNDWLTYDLFVFFVKEVVWIDRSRTKFQTKLNAEK